MRSQDTVIDNCDPGLASSPQKPDHQHPPLHPNIPKSSLILIQSTILSLKDQLSLLSQLPSTIQAVSEHVTNQILNLSQYYNQIIYELKGRCEDLRMAFLNYQEAKHLEKERLLEELEGKDQTIKDILVRYQALERKYTQKTRESINYPQLTTEIKQLHQSNNQLVGILSKYQRHIEKIESQQQSISKQSPSKNIKLQERNDFLRDRYFEFKKENQMLKSRLSSTGKSDVRQANLKANDTTGGTLRHGQFTIRTLPASPIKNHYHSTINSLSKSRDKNSIPKPKPKVLFKYPNQSLKNNQSTKSQKKTPKQKVKQLLEKYQKTKEQRKSMNKYYNEVCKQMKQKQGQGVINDFLSTLRSGLNM